MSERYRKIISVVALGIILVGIVLLIYTLVVHFGAVNKTERLLQKNGNKVTDENGELAELTELTEDMHVKEVTQLKNCIDIPKLKIRVPIVEGTTSEVLRTGAGHFKGTANVGELGNACYAGHYSTIYNCIFNDLPKIKKGDTIDMYNKKGIKYTYYVIDKYITYPTDLSVLDKTDETIMTLVTCAKKGTMRLIVVGKFMSATDYKEYVAQMRKEAIDSMMFIQSDMGDISIVNYLKMKNKIRVKER